MEPAKSSSRRSRLDEAGPSALPAEAGETQGFNQISTLSPPLDKDSSHASSEEASMEEKELASENSQNDSFREVFIEDLTFLEWI